MHLHPNVFTFDFAHKNAFVPRAIKFVVDFISALIKPTASTTATTGLASLRGAAFWAFKVHHAGNRLCYGCDCVYVHGMPSLWEQC